LLYKNELQICNTNLLALKLYFFVQLKDLKPKLVSIIFEKLGHSSKKAQHFSISKIVQLMPFRKIVAVYIENHAINTKEGGTRYVLVPLSFKVLN
jgi:hypothetical protein